MKIKGTWTPTQEKKAQTLNKCIIDFKATLFVPLLHCLEKYIR